MIHLASIFYFIVHKIFLKLEIQHWRKLQLFVMQVIHIYSRLCIIHIFLKHYYGDTISQKHANYIKIL